MLEYLFWSSRGELPIWLFSPVYFSLGSSSESLSLISPFWFKYVSTGLCSRLFCLLFRRWFALRFYCLTFLSPCNLWNVHFCMLCLFTTRRAKHQWSVLLKAVLFPSLQKLPAVLSSLSNLHFKLFVSVQRWGVMQKCVCASHALGHLLSKHNQTQ